jgi:hypothetical protein
VRTPDAGRLVQALRAANLPAVERDGYVVVEGATPEQVAPVMVDNRIEVHEMGSSTESLESLFFSLTGGEPVAPGQAAAPFGSYRQLGDGSAPPAPPAPAPPAPAPPPSSAAFPSPGPMGAEQ